MSNPMSSAQQGKEAIDAAIKSTVVRLFGDDAIERIEVRLAEDQAGDDTIFVTIFLKTVQENMPASRLGDTIAAIAESLQRIGVRNFPFVTFLAPGYEHAEDTRPAA